ncbi:MAG: FMN-binding protein [Candidatus Zapsychrus exili]|nr:FMN-binding protein [Candidatus Zapsychrus exili]
MKRYKIINTLFIIILLIGILSNFKSPKEIISTNSSDASSCSLVFPDADEFIKETSNPAYYKAYKINPETKRKTTAGIVLLTKDTAPEIKGYSGPINIAIGINLNGVISNVAIVSHSETSSYIKEINSFLRQFKNKKIKDSFKIGIDIDAISRATVTSSAIAKSVAVSINKIFNLNDDPILTDERMKIDEIVIPLILFLLSIYAVILKNNKLRLLSLFISFIYLGIIKASMVSIIHIANLSLFNLPNFNTSILWYSLMTLNILTLIFFKNVYCLGVCPFAAVENVISKIAKFLHIKQMHTSSKIDKNARLIKYGILLTSLIIAFLFKNSDNLNFEVFILLFTRNASYLGWGFVTITLIACALNSRFWCKYFCPVGAFNKTIRRIISVSSIMSFLRRHVKSRRDHVPLRAGIS